MTRKPMNSDSTIEDIHRTRERIAEKFGGDVNAILEDARKRQEASGRPVWQGPPSDKSLRTTGESDVSQKDHPTPTSG